MVALATVAAANGQNLLLNGDFETGPHNSLSTITNWATSGFVRTAQQGSTSGDWSAALRISGDSEGNTLSQTFTTTVGQAYLVEFDAGIFGVPDNGVAPLKLNVQAIGTTTLLDEIVQPPEAGTFTVQNVAFQHYQFAFVADSASTTIRFIDIGLGNTGADTEVDTVSVMATTIPSPTTLPLANGDFELAPYNTTGTVTGWTASGAARIAVLAEGSTSGSFSAALSPGGDFEDDCLSQRFFTTPGNQYAIDFDAAIYGVASSNPFLRVRIQSGQTVLDQTIGPPCFNTFDPAAIAFQHFHYVFTAAASISTVAFFDVGLGNENADVVVDTVSIVDAPPPQSFANWQAAHFDPNQLNDPQVSGWTADPDHDGIANGLEYFFNTDPLAGTTIPNAANLPRTAIETFNSSQYATYTFHRLIGWNGNDAVVGVSDDLVTWDDTGANIQQVSVTPAGDGATEIVKVRLTPSLDQGPTRKKFFRLNLSQ